MEIKIQDHMAFCYEISGPDLFEAIELFKSHIDHVLSQDSKLTR